MMSEKVSRPDKTTGPTASVRRVLIGDFFSVTWRMVVPTVLGLAIGYWADRMLGSSPLCFLIGATLGFAFGIYLAVRLINATKESR